MREMNIDKAIKFANSIDMNELFDYIRKITGIPDLKFGYKVISNNSSGEISIAFSSDDFVDSCKVLKLMFEEIRISQFNSVIKYDEDNNTYYYCGDADFTYEYAYGGISGYNFLSYIYKNGLWQFEINR